MRIVTVVLFFGAFFTDCYCLEVRKGDTKTSENDTVIKISATSFRAIAIRSFKDAAKCFGTLEAACFVDTAEEALVDTNRAFWDEADRSTPETKETPKPSALIKSINHFITEVTDMFKDSITGWFRDAKEDDGDDDDDEADGATEDDDEDDDDKDDDDDSRRIEEARGKKKKKKKAIIKLLLLGAVIATKIKLLLKVLAAHLQVKFLVIALASLLLNAIRFYFDLKKGHQPQKVIYYEHAQHQHHYDGGEEDWHSGGGWSRSYDEEQKKTAQDIAYAQQKPQGVSYTRHEDKPNYSWAA